jgi:hypothetical protein
LVTASSRRPGGFSTTVVTSDQSTPRITSVSVSDVNTDDNLDISVMTSATTIYYGDGAGNFSTTPP